MLLTEAALVDSGRGRSCMLAWLRCLVRRYHRPRRYPLGGFRCVECGAAGADLDEMGFTGSGWVAPTRRTFDRKHAAVTVSAGW
jgi:hypothetical protein